jgi:DNA polymerase elongation subunit (family B)
MARSINIKVFKSFRLIDFDVFDVFERDKSSPAQSPRGGGDGGGYQKAIPSIKIQMFGINERGETCSILVTDFQPFFYAKVPDTWTNSNIGDFVRVLKQQSGRDDIAIAAELVQYHKLYGFDGGRKYNFVRMVFQSLQHMNAIKNLWYVASTAPPAPGRRPERRLKRLKCGNSLIDLYEGGIPPLLRYFHIEGISPSGWIKVPLLCKTDDTTTTCDFEFICTRRDIKPQPEKETRVPYKICSFDIEASSSHGDFPIPKKTYKRLATNIIDLIYSGDDVRFGGMEAMLRKSVMTAFGYDTIENIDVVYPKFTPTPKQLAHLINQLLQCLVDTETATDAANNTIEFAFERMRAAAAVVGAAGADGGDDAGAEEEGDTDAALFEIRDDDSDAEGEAATTRRRAGAAGSRALVEFLADSKIARDKKIDALNYVFTTQLCFPELEGDKVTFIGSTFMKYGEPEPYMNHCIVLGSCDAVAGATIETVEKEADLLLKWKDLMVRENPDIVIGYNIFGFDYEFLYRRAEENRCVDSFLEMTRRVGEKSGKKNYKTDNITDIEQTSVVLASGEYELRYFKMTGRLQIDMYTYMRRDYNLASYKLDDVAGQFIGDDIRGAAEEAAEGRTRLCTGNLTGLHVGDFIHIEVIGFTTDTIGEKLRIVALKSDEGAGGAAGAWIEIEKNVQIENLLQTGKKLRWGLAKDDVTPQDIFRLSREGAAERAIVARYCIQDCNLVHHLMNKIDVLTGYIEMSRICSVPISFLVFRGQGIKLTSFVAKKCREKDTLMPDLPRGGGAADGYEGAIVLPPKCQMYFDNPVACVDYASLYPSSMISENLSHDSKVWTKEYDLTGALVCETGEKNSAGRFIYDDLPGYEYVETEFDTFQYRRPKPTAKAIKVKTGRKVCRWAQSPDGQKSIMPAILEELLRARADTRKLAKTVADPFMQNILDKRQLGYKVTANSLYGQCGAQTSTFYEKDIAASTTATGRKMITYAQRMIEEVYGGGRDFFITTTGTTVLTYAEYVYGDTDSVFFTFNLRDKATGAPIRGRPALEATIEIAQDVARLCTMFLKSPMELAYEKTLMPFILLSKKRYVGMLYETNPTKGKLKYMGLSLKRRDSCDYLKDTYGNIIKMLMAGESILTAVNWLNAAMTELSEGRVPIEKLVVTRALRSDYKNPAQIAHKVLADRIAKRDPGNKPKSGDRLKFAYVVGARGALLGERVETPEFIREQGLKLDYTYYITNQLMKPLQQLFGLAIEQIYTERGYGDTKVRTFRRDMEKLRREFPDLEIFMKKKEAFCSKEVKRLLFDAILTKIQNSVNGNREITGFYGRA